MKLLVIVLFTFYAMCYVNGNPITTEIDEIKGQLKHISHLLLVNDVINHTLIINKFNISIYFNLV